jgi:hypothetical protein
MSVKTYCPIRIIGFDPPEKGQRDMRLCTKDCAWYNVAESKCAVSIIAAGIDNIDAQLNDISDFTGDIAMSRITGGDDYDVIGFDEEAEYYYSRTGKET